MLREELTLLAKGKSVRGKRRKRRACSLVRRAILPSAGVLLLGGLALVVGRFGLNSPKPSSVHTASFQADVSPIREADNEFKLGWEWCRRDTADGIRQGWDHFTRALKLDPKCAAAYNGLFEVLVGVQSSSVASPVPRERAAAQMRASAKKLMELDPHLAEAHVARALGVSTTHVYVIKHRIAARVRLELRALSRRAI